MQSPRMKLWLVLVLILFTHIKASATDVVVKDVLRTLDGLRKIHEDVTAKVQMAMRDAEQGDKLIEAVYFAKDLDDTFLMVMTKPESEKGNGYLKSGKNFWMYRRNTRTFQHVGRSESISGTDANAGDFEAPKYELQYTAAKEPDGKERVSEELLSKVPVYKIEIVSSVPDVDYPKKILWVRQDNYLPLKEQSFSLSGTLMNTQYYLKYSEINGHYIAVKQLVVDEFEKGNKTLWDITDISFKKLPDETFSKAYLENLSK